MPRCKVYPDTEWFHFHNENPKGRRTGDCVIRAIALATNQTWDDVLDGLVKVAHRTHYDLECVQCYGLYLSELGWIKMKQPRKSDNTKYTGKEFINYIDAKNYPFEVKILAHIGGHHITCFVEDTHPDNPERVLLRCWDIWDPTDGTIGNYWINQN